MITLPQIADAIEAFIKANLNTHIAVQNSTNTYGITLKTVSASAYFFQTMNDAIANFDPFIYYGVADVEAPSSEGGGTIEKITFNALLVVSDRGEDLLIGRRMLLYREAWKAMIGPGWANIHRNARMTLTSLVPVAFTEINTNHPYRAVGIEIVTELG